jgi:hypothetical protein
MAGMLFLSLMFDLYFSCAPPCAPLFSLMLFIGSFLDTATEEQRVNSRVEALLQLSKANDVDFWADEDRTHRIVQFQYQAAQVQDFLNFCTCILAMVYNAMFPRNP